MTADQEPRLLQRSVLLAAEARKQSPLPSLEADQILRSGLSLLPRPDPDAPLTHEDDVNRVAFSPHGEYLATASLDKTARVWDPTSGKEVARMPHEDKVRSVAFSPDGEYLATVSDDRTARVWEVASGDEIARMPHEYRVEHVVFSPDGTYLVTASASIIRTWPWWPEDLINEACTHLTRNLTEWEWQQNVGDEPPYQKTYLNLP